MVPGRIYPPRRGAAPAGVGAEGLGPPGGVTPSGEAKSEWAILVPPVKPSAKAKRFAKLLRFVVMESSLAAFSMMPRRCRPSTHRTQPLGSGHRLIESLRVFCRVRS